MCGVRTANLTLLNFTTKTERGLRVGAWGLDLVAQIFFGLGPSTGWVQIIQIKRYTKHDGCFRSILCEKPA